MRAVDRTIVAVRSRSLLFQRHLIEQWLQYTGVCRTAYSLCRRMSAE